jgi:hypothetical protein
MTSPVVASQPRPTGGKLQVAYLIERSTQGTFQEVAKDILLRLETGAKKYGSVLMTFNGRSADLDLYQELCDAIGYLTQKIFETREEEEVIGLIEDADELYRIAQRCRDRLVRDGILPIELT